MRLNITHLDTSHILIHVPTATAAALSVSIDFGPSVSSVAAWFKGLSPGGWRIVTKLAVTIKSFAIIQSFGVQPVAPVEFE
jgi:hypothetical protein